MNKQLVISIPVMMTMSFLYGIVVDPGRTLWLKNLIMPLTFLMVYPIFR